MKKYNFSLKMLALIICAIVSINWFYIPLDNLRVSARGNELRGVWVATVANIDYPTKQATDPQFLKDELVKILDNCKTMGFNAVFFQVRPTSDAFYKSDIFPWSRYLTGTQGVAPSDGFDPLEFAIEEAHNRGIELHAWINPYRITNSADDNSKLSDNNPAVLYPELVVTDSDGKMYFNPGERKSRELIINGAVEIVENYDVDGLHMDDYFYPGDDFNDDATYSYYKEQYPDKGDWRRAMVNELVKEMDKAVHNARADIVFGISPRGIWANSHDMPGGSDTKGGGSYNSVYADSKAWVENGWVDYIMPQIYWNIGHEAADYSTLAKWWADTVDGTGVKLYIGEGAYRTVSSDLEVWNGENGKSELEKHIEIGRNNANISGYCMYTYNSFINNPTIYTLMKEVNAEKEELTDEPAVEVDSAQTGEYVNKFKDLGNYSWAMESIDALASQGIIKGRSETEFDPDSFITRADNTVILLRVLGKTAEFTDNFTDVYKSKYYYDEIGMAKALGIASGYGDGRFDPEGNIKRQDMATLAYRVLTEEGVLTSIPNTGILNELKDKDYIDFYARDAMAACVGAGLMSGYGDGTIKPQGNASRIEVAIFMHRIQKMINEKK